MKPERKIIGWWEEYRCGCTSETTRYKKDLLGYCGHHGEDRRHAYPEMSKDIPKPKRVCVCKGRKTTDEFCGIKSNPGFISCISCGLKISDNLIKKWNTRQEGGLK